MNFLFAKYATGSAFRIDLSTRMVVALLNAADGKKTDTGQYGVNGLVNRGIMEHIDGQDGQLYKKVRLTEVGQKIAELCRMAGLDGEI